MYSSSFFSFANEAERWPRLQPGDVTPRRGFSGKFIPLSTLGSSFRKWSLRLRRRLHAAPSGALCGLPCRLFPGSLKPRQRPSRMNMNGYFVCYDYFFTKRFLDFSRRFSITRHRPRAARHFVGFEYVIW